MKNDFTGILFGQQSSESVIEGVEEFISKKSEFKTDIVRENSLDFGEARFRSQIKEFVNSRMLEKQNGS